MRDQHHSEIDELKSTIVKLEGENKDNIERIIELEKDIQKKLDEYTTGKKV